MKDKNMMNKLLPEHKAKFITAQHQDAEGMYLPELESDACGIGLITQFKGKKS